MKGYCNRTLRWIKRTCIRVIFYFHSKIKVRIPTSATGAISAIAGTTIGGAVIAASPIIVARAIIGGLFAMGRKIFKG
jgi:hypothetical protein